MPDEAVQSDTDLFIMLTPEGGQLLLKSFPTVESLSLAIGKGVVNVCATAHVTRFLGTRLDLFLNYPFEDPNVRRALAALSVGADALTEAGRLMAVGLDPIEAKIESLQQDITIIRKLLLVGSEPVQDEITGIRRDFAELYAELKASFLARSDAVPLSSPLSEIPTPSPDIASTYQDAAKPSS